MSTSEIAFGYLGGVVILGTLVWIGVALHMAYTKLDELLDHLKNCSAIMARAPLKHGGPWGKLLLIGGISGTVTFPGFHLKRGATETIVTPGLANGAATFTIIYPR
ncbi:hypothetical protein [Pseudomonas chlororaphis]|uniref:hypothetical protein n=1 Tax=Pseudomonas chlororaphis TaxID=587753 RepID=UPI002181E60A|nr:hypothetical protein [Pseudomonas chlororaphis]